MFDPTFLLLMQEPRDREAETAAAAEKFLLAVWRYADNLFDVRLPYSPVLEEYAVMDGSLRVSRTLLTGKLRIQGDHPEISAVLKMYLASRMGSEKIA